MGILVYDQRLSAIPIFAAINHLNLTSNIVYPHFVYHFSYWSMKFHSEAPVSERPKVV